MNSLLRWLATALALLPLAVLWPTLEGLLASVAWVSLVALSRVAAHGKARGDRLSVDALVFVICLAGFLVGGLYWAPATAGFWVADRVELQGTSNGAANNVRIRGALVPLGMAAFLTGLLGIAAFLFLPTYSVARSNPTPVGGVSASVTRLASGLEAGLGNGGAVVVAFVGLLFAAVALGSIIAGRGQRAGRILLGIAGTGVVLVSILGAMTIGLFLLPGVSLTLLTLWAAFAMRVGTRPQTP